MTGLNDLWWWGSNGTIYTCTHKTNKAVSMKKLISVFKFMNHTVCLCLQKANSEKIMLHSQQEERTVGNHTTNLLICGFTRSRLIISLHVNCTCITLHPSENFITMIHEEHGGKKLPGGCHSNKGWVVTVVGWVALHISREMLKCHPLPSLNLK